MRGLYFEEFEVGRVYRHPFTRTVTEADNVFFTSLTMNTQPLHLDHEFAKTTPHGRPLFNSLFSPLFHLLRPIPPIAFIPIVILWFGLSETGKFFLVFWGVFFTVWLSTHLGVQKVDNGMIRAALVLGTPPRKLLREVVFFGALPYIVVGLRTAVSISFYTLVAAELAGTFVGIVYRIEIAQQNLQTGQVMGGLVVLGAISFIADRAFAALSQRLVWWR